MKCLPFSCGLLLLILILAGAGLPGIARGDPPAPESGRPNVVIILADDLGYGDPRCYNRESKIPTPNLDRLAKEGLRFTDAHTPSGVCTPTRYGLLTGRYAWRTRLKSGVLWGYSPLLIETNRLTLASLLKRHGYYTACIGKWHLGLGDTERTDYGRPLIPGPNACGFDYFFGIPASLDMDPYLYVENERPVEPPTGHIEASQHRRQDGSGFWRAGAIAPGFKHAGVLPALTRKAVACIEDRAGEPPPFLLYLALSAPHTPWLPLEEFRGKSGAGYYGDFVAQVDDTVGQVLEALEQTGAARETLVLFTSDNGAHWPDADERTFNHLANGPFRGQKADIWEGGHRVPLIVRWPGRTPAGGASVSLVCLTDVLATLAGIVGETLPEDSAEDSVSFLPVLLGEDASDGQRRPVIHHSMDGMFALREGPWKLIAGLGSGGFTSPRRLTPEPGGPKGQLYHLERDPGEMHNLYEEHPGVVERLTVLLDRCRESGRSR